jgi:hypothetical protein
MMQCLYSHSCPEIGFALSQLACFTFNPKCSHELALIHLGGCLKHLLDKGMILCPMKSDEFQMDVYVDSDFMICVAMSTVMILMLFEVALGASSC